MQYELREGKRRKMEQERREREEKERKEREEKERQEQLERIRRQEEEENRLREEEEARRRREEREAEERARQGEEVVVAVEAEGGVSTYSFRHSLCLFGLSRFEMQGFSFILRDVLNCLCVIEIKRFLATTILNTLEKCLKVGTVLLSSLTNTVVVMLQSWTK